MTHPADIIDLLAGITPDSPLAALRQQRRQTWEQAQRSFTALFEPADAGSFPLRERYAIAAFEADLHDFAPATAFYQDLLTDEAPEFTDAVKTAAAEARSTGPYGEYREPGLAGESAPGPVWRPDDHVTAAVGRRVSAALAHTHLLVYRPREAGPGDLQALVDAGWNADDIVRLSQLIAFLAFQLRAAAGLRALARTTSARPGEGDPR
ncbi:CMD domain protein [Saccharopolyspora indica]|uniref:CMD domain protein n=1 Tax=Saccharopolyspora indica TaxID=1229659 RepID=UPI0022EAA9E6|nr:CMD domain protein [Saccharopolyspora indica]MDA3644149.1 CMD domain protein [Saccharopolyspora indica]